MDETRNANLKGVIVGFINNETIAIVETDFGKAYLHVGGDYDYRLKEEDEIEVEEVGWYISNGQIVTVLDYQYRLNGVWYTLTSGDILSNSPLFQKEGYVK